MTVAVKEGITYHLSFQAKSQFDNNVLVNIQEDNSWAVTLEQHLDLKAEEWKEFNYTINSTLTNGSNPIYLKFLLSGPNVTPGSFKIKNVSMTAEVEEGSMDAPADTVINNGGPVKGIDYVFELKSGDYRTKFLSCVEKPARLALIKVNGATLPDGAVNDGKIVIPASHIGSGSYRIELALDGYNSITLSGMVRENVNQGSTSDNSNSGGTSSNNNSSGSNTPSDQTSTPVTTNDKGENTATGYAVSVAKVDNTGKAVAEVAQDKVMNAITEAGREAKKQNSKLTAVEIRVEAPANTKAVEASIPRETMSLASENKIGVFTVSTPVAAISFDSKALSTLTGASGTNVVMSAARVEESSLSNEAQKLVGDRPVFRFSVTSGDQTISKFAGNVTVTVPYTPGKDEDTNALVIYYINDKGEAVTVRNCAYHPESGTISFTTNHFSDYAVGYNKIVFTDVAPNSKYGKAVSFIAARGIDTGIGNELFGQWNKVTRGEFLAMLMKAYDLTPDNKPKSNYADASTTAYAGYLSAAKRLGLCASVTNDKFLPDKKITRQEMAVMAYDLLKAIDKLPQGNTGKALSTYSDAGKVTTSAQEAVTLLTQTGIITGSGKKLNPKSSVIRGEAAQVLYNLMMN